MSVVPPAWRVEEWLEPGDGGAIEYSDYWNDPDAERGKPFDVIGGDFARLEQYLGDVGLREDLNECLRAIGLPLAGRGIDVAAGTLWAAPVLLGAGAVDRLYCVEFSRHRLLDIGPAVLDHYRVDPGRVVLAYGSFYDLRLPDASLDFAFLSQALHHADRPDALLGELHRVLRRGGVAIVIGEHLLRPRHYAIYAAKAGLWLLPRAMQRSLPATPLSRRPRLRPAGADLEPPDPVLGDHLYTRAEYDAMFERAGFDARRVRRRGSQYQSFVLIRRP